MYVNVVVAVVVVGCNCTHYVQWLVIVDRYLAKTFRIDPDLDLNLNETLQVE